MSLRRTLALEAFRRYRYNNARLHPLRTLFWECTLRCNMHCRHCGSDCKTSATVPDMPASDFLRVIDGLSPHIDPHNTFVIFTGGEALLRDDIEEVGLQLYSRGYPWGLVTNGQLLTSARLDSLQRAGIHSLSISLDGLEEAHNWLRCNPESFAGATRAISLLAQSDEVLWDVVTCVNPVNYDTLPQLRDYLVRLGVRRWRIFTIAPMGRASANPALRLSAAQLRGVLDFIRAERRKPDNPVRVSYACEGFLDGYEHQVRDSFFYCQAGIEVASVLCDGTISGCTSIRSNMAQGNVYEDDFWQVWQERFQLFRDRSWTRKEQCSNCKVWRYCEGNGLHLYDDERHLLFCHHNRLKE